MAGHDMNLSETNGTSLVSTVGVFLTLSWVSVALRTYTRAVLMKGFQWDDWIMLLSQGIFTVYCSFLFKGVRSGIGQHNDALPNDAVRVEALKWQSLAIGTYILLMMFIKLSIGIFLLRLAAQRVYTWILRVSIVVVTIWSLAIFFWNIFQCSPVDKQWDYRLAGGHCVSPGEIVSAAYAMTALTIISDWLYALLPIPMLWNVKMSMQAKITVILILSLGIFASVATLVRIRYLPDMANTEDILYAGTNAMIWTIIEAGLAIVASSLATIRPLLRAMRVRGFEGTDHNTGTTGNSGHSKRSFQHSLGSRRPPVTSAGTYGLSDLPASNEHLTECIPSKVSSAGSATTAAVAGRRAVVVTEVADPDRIGPVRTVNVGEGDRSDVYIIQGRRTGSGTGAGAGAGARGGTRSTWSGRSTESMEQIYDLEAQSQEHPSFGIGSETEK